MINDINRLYKDKYDDPNKYPFPNELTTDPKKKLLADYCCQYSKAIFSSHMRGKTSLPANAYSYIQELRDYGSGNQDVRKYLPLINSFNDEDEVSVGGSVGDVQRGRDFHRKGYKHINFEVVSPAKKIKNMFLGMIDKKEQDVFVNNIDEDSGAEEELIKNRAFVEAKTAKWVAQIRKTMGLEQDIFSDQYPEDISIEELDAYQLTGGFKLAYARIMEKLIRHTEKTSKWDGNLKRKLISDILDINIAAVRCVYDPITYQDRWEYVDPETLVIQYSKEHDFSDAEYAGYFKLEKVSVLLSKGLDRKELRKATENYSGCFDNPSKTKWSSLNSSDPTGNWYFDWKVPVFHCAWIDVDVQRRLEYQGKTGKVNIFDLEWEDEVKYNKKDEKRGIKKKEYSIHEQKVYQCSWIVDTDIVFDYGVMPNQSRKTPAKAELPFIVYRGLPTDSNNMFGSVIETIKPMLDQIQLNWIRWQDAMAKSPGTMYTVNWRLLSNITMGGKKMEPLDALKMGIKSGLLPYMDVQFGSTYRGGDTLPIRKVDGSSIQEVNIAKAQIDNNLFLIYEFLGITPQDLGANTDPNMPVQNAQMASMGSSNINWDFLSGVFEIKKMAAEISSRRIELLIKYNKTAKETYARIIGKKDVQVLFEATRKGVEYGISMEPRPSDTEKIELIQLVKAAMSTGRDGDQQITLDQGMYILECIHSGSNLKELRLRLSFLIRRNEERKQARRERNIELQNKNLMAMEQQKTQKEFAIKKADIDGEIALENVKFQNELKLERAKANIEIKKGLTNTILTPDETQG